jgi:stearoyl-CoA desaturase (Delta-9 desaturase)
VTARSRKRIAHLLGLSAPLVGFIVAVILLWNRLVGWVDVGLLVAMYLAAGVGITVGFHRLLTHHAFATHRPTAYVLAGLGSLALQGSVIDWVADHRRHHAHADRDGDPHSPHLEQGSLLRGLWHAHAGWLFASQGEADKQRYAADLLADPVMRFFDRAFAGFVALSLLLPFFAGWALTGSLAGAMTGLLWGGLVRVFLFHQVIFSVNSIGHYFGRRRFATEDRSTNVPWLAPLSLGESWHHNHHAFPRAATLRFRWFELDPSGSLIRGLERIGLAWNVIRIAPERRDQRLIPDSAFRPEPGREAPRATAKAAWRGSR